MDKIRTWFSDRTFFAPFGRYEGSRRTDEPFNQALVGREHQRARLLNLLFSMGRTGAILVTGQRGSGKTSFVNYCLDEYRQNVYRRWGATNVGRTFFWDRLGNLFLVGFLPLLGLLLSSELIDSTLAVGRTSAIEFALLFLLVLVALSPMLLAARTVDLLWKSFRFGTLSGYSPTTDGEESAPPFLRLYDRLTQVAFTPVFLCHSVLFAFLFAVYPFGALPCLALSQLIFLLAASHMIGEVVCLEANPHRHRRQDGRRQQLRLGDLQQIKSVAPLLLPFMIVCCIPVAFPGTSDRAELLASSSSLVHLCLFFLSASALCFGVALVVQATDARRSVSDPIPQGSTDHSTPAEHIAKWQAYAVAITSGLFVLLFVAHPSLRESSPKLLTVLFVGILPVVVRGAFKRHQLRGSTGRDAEIARNPPFRLLLLLKCAALTLLSLQLIQPLLSRLVTFHIDVASSHDLGPIVGKILQMAPDHSLLGTIALTESASSEASLFGNLHFDFFWLVVGVLLFLVVGSMEFSWIVRAGVSSAEDRSLHNPPDLVAEHAAELRTEQTSDRAAQETVEQTGEKTDGHYKKALSLRSHKLYRDLLDDTLFTGIYGAWLPVLVTRVNLGFDDLDYRRVVEAMMSGLRTSYADTFLHWSRPLVAGKKLAFCLTLLVTALVSGDFLFSIQRRDGTGNLSQALTERRYCAHTMGSDGEAKIDTPTALWMTCGIGGERLVQALQWRPFSEEDNSPRASRSRSSSSAHSRASSSFPPDQESGSDYTGGILGLLFDEGSHPLLQLRIYHLLLILFLWFLYRAVSRYLPISFHRRIHERMNELYENLSASVREEFPAEISSPFSLATAMFRMKVRQKSTGPLDPRTVELQFLQALEEMYARSARLPFAGRHRISLPAPDLIFVFDELDKISIGRVYPNSEISPKHSGEPAEQLDRSRERARKLHLLFGDLKNLISSARARFIFLGARNLHDESLADYADRNPLLSNIFEEDIYLPSLLSDDSYYARQQVRDPALALAPSDERPQRNHKSGPLGSDRYLVPPGIDVFLAQCHWRSRELFSLSTLKRDRAWFSPWREARTSLAYVRSSASWRDTGLDSDHYLKFFHSDSGEAFSDATSLSLRRELIQFLACRSLGNVKRLRALVETLLWPADHVVSSSCRLKASCDHVLSMNDVVRFRIQLVATIYRELLPVLEDKIYDGDDKLVTGILYLADFILKFHRRGFTWGNLGRLDELVHIHRPPDLRLVIEQVIVAWSDRFLHAIRNGMYDYRFESSFARELAYISHRSERELAAFNFTLDESQALKAVFQARLREKETSSQLDFVSGLGELHEFDEEYELARLQYRRAIELLDDQFRSGVSHEEHHEATYEGFREESRSGRESLRIRVTWGVARVRLMLQIAMSHEQSREFEQAQLEYRNARTLAMAIISGIESETDPSESWGHVSTVKHRSILFQPIFAEAWVSEKLASGVDTSTSTLELGLEALRSRLPEFVHRENLAREMLPKRGTPVRHANFSLTLAELHDKAGDLYFFKGKQLDSCRQPGEGPFPLAGRLEGYLFKSFEHYAEAAHYARRYISYRIRSSKNKLNPFPVSERWETLSKDRAPDFVLRTLAGIFVDLAEVGLARISLFTLFDQLEGSDCDDLPERPAVKSFFHTASASIWEWIGSPPDDTSAASMNLKDVDSVFPELIREPDAIRFKSWLGVYKAVPEKGWREKAVFRIENSGDLTDLGRLCWSLTCSNFSADCLSRGGYFKAAAREKLRIANTVSSFLWFYFLMEKFGCGGTDCKARYGSASLISLIRIGVNALSEAATLFLTGRPWSWSGGQRPRTASSDQIPPEFLSVLASMGNNLSYLRGHDRIKGHARETKILDEQFRLLYIVRSCWPQWHDDALEKGFPSKKVPEIAAIKRGSLKDLLGDFPQERMSDLFCSLLCENIARNSFPLRDRLVGILGLLCHAAMTTSGRGLITAKASAEQEPKVARQKRQVLLWKETGHHIIEFLKLKKLYGGSLHFSPFQSGFALAALGLILGEGKDPGAASDSVDPVALVESAGISLDSILQIATRDLQLSQEMYTMRRGYYDVISDLYYLYDDFNDRTIHYNHSLQMASSELCVLLLGKLEKALEERRPWSGCCD